jgi:predicted Zn-dependent protease
MSSPSSSSARSSRPRRLLADDARVMSRAECEALFHRIVGFGTGGGDTTVSIRSTWTGSFRWGRNRPTTSGDTTNRSATITRSKNGASVSQEVTKLDDASLKQSVQAIEQELASQQGDPQVLGLLGPQQYLDPKLWNDATARLKVQDLSQSVRGTVSPIVDAKLVAAGYAEVGATAWGIFNTQGLVAYGSATGAMYTETIRNMEGSASGWAGKSHTDWSQLGALSLSSIALRKCAESANPVAIEPGRYTAILEPDVVSRMFSWAVEAMERVEAEGGGSYFSGKQSGTTKLNTQVLDSRITITSDPTDPECGYLPFDPDGNPYQKVTWVENGILKNLAYSRAYAHRKLGTDVALPNPQAFRISGGTTSIEEMIKTTERGVLVTNTSGLREDDHKSLNLTAVTRNGLWLIENGKITHPIKNFWFNESPMFVFNKIVQLGPPVRTYGADRQSGGGVLRDIPARALNDGRQPIVAPALKVQDFNFTRLTDAI